MRFILIVVVAVQLATSAILGYAIVQNQQAHTALCSLQADLQRRHDANVKFLEENPGDFVLGNIPRETIQTSIDNQRATLDSLASLECEA